MTKLQVPHDQWVVWVHPLFRGHIFFLLLPPFPSFPPPSPLSSLLACLPFSLVKILLCILNSRSLCSRLATCYHTWPNTVCVCAFVDTGVPMCTCVWRPKDPFRHCLLCVLRNNDPLTWHSLSRLSGLSTMSEETACLCLLSPDVTGRNPSPNHYSCFHCCLFFTWAHGIQPESWCSQGKHFNRCASC